MPIKLWLHIILSTLHIISDRDYQYKNWVLCSDKNIQTSYIEIMCNLFDEGDVKNFIDNYAREAGLTYLQIIELKKISDAIDQYDGSKLSHEDLLKDPQWIKITDMAKAALKILPKDETYGWQAGL